MPRLMRQTASGQFRAICVITTLWANRSDSCVCAEHGRADIYLVSEALRSLPKVKDNQITPEEAKTLAGYRTNLDNSTKFIPKLGITELR